MKWEGIKQSILSFLTSNETTLHIQCITNNQAIYIEKEFKSLIGDAEMIKKGLSIYIIKPSEKNLISIYSEDSNKCQI